MNALPTLRLLQADIKNTERWLTDAFLSPSALAGMADRMIAYAAELKTLKDRRIADLKETGPKAFIEGGALNVILLREGKEVFYDFTERSVKVVRTQNKLTPKGGWTFFLQVLPQNFGSSTYGIEITEEESDILARRIDEAWAAEFGEFEDDC